MLEAPDDMEVVGKGAADETVGRFALMALVSGWLAFSLVACLSEGPEVYFFLRLPVWTGCCGVYLS